MLTDDRVRELDVARRHLLDQGVCFERGLSRQEFGEIEDRFQFRFPDDLKEFLSVALPVSHEFVNWRAGEAEIRFSLDGPEEGICFDIRNNRFWWPEWGPRPASDKQAVEIARWQIRLAPRLIPVHGHSFLASRPPEIDCPVFSISQADAIHRGRNLAEHLHWILHDESDEDIEDRYPVYSPLFVRVPFWTDLVIANL